MRKNRTIGAIKPNIIYINTIPDVHLPLKLNVSSFKSSVANLQMIGCSYEYKNYILLKFLLSAALISASMDLKYND